MAGTPSGVGCAAIARQCGVVPSGEQLDAAVAAREAGAERVRHARTLDSLFDAPVTLVSAHTGEGLDELWKTITSLPSRTAA